jgi:outer membrane protein
MTFFPRFVLLLIFVVCSLGRVAMAEELPLWEAGLGGAAVQLPAYRGATESSTHVLPIPYIVYRGEYLKADREGVRGVLFESDQYEINLSFAASPPVDSSGVKARQGMPDLRASLEFGPSLDIKLWQSPGKGVRLRMFAPLRVASTLESEPKFIGWQLTPRLNLDIDNPLGLHGWTLGTVGGPIFGSQEQHAYFYGVAPQFSHANRPAYEARAGFAGIQVVSALWKRFPGFWAGGFLRYDNLSGAVFEDSPLVTQKNGFSGGFAITWVMGKSSQLVPVD